MAFITIIILPVYNVQLTLLEILNSLHSVSLSWNSRCHTRYDDAEPTDVIAAPAN